MQCTTIKALGVHHTGCRRRRAGGPCRRGDPLATTIGAAVSSSHKCRGMQGALGWLIVLGLTGCGGGDFPDGFRTTATSADASAPASRTESFVVIRRQPLGVEVREGSVAQFGVDADGPRSITYQWLRDGEPIEGETGSILRVLVTPADHLARISVIVKAGGATIQSDSAVLRVGRV